MTCPLCGSRSYVIDSRHRPDCTYRRQQCKTCGHRFTTEEIEVDSPGRVNTDRAVKRLAEEIRTAREALERATALLEAMERGGENGKTV